MKRMKRAFLAAALAAGVAVCGFAQETNLYSFFVNVVGENFRFPLIGLVNIARGDQSQFQFGMINWSMGGMSPLQIGYVNTAAGDFSGAQFGTVNITAGDVRGGQYGFINAAGEFDGVQIGFINTAANGGQGLQFGFVNVSPQRLRGFQIGFVNFADSIEDGIPVGVVSIVRNGGFRAVEYSFTEFHPVSVGLKLGVDVFYSTVIFAFNPSGDITDASFSAGVGFGTIIPINDSFFINPELNLLSSVGESQMQLLSFVPNFGFNANERVSITAAPSFTWAFNTSGYVQEPVFSIFNHAVNKNHSVVTGARVSVRFRF